MARVLLVDDDEDGRALFSRALRARDHHVDECASGEGALSQLEQASYDIMILDVRLPGVSGYEVARRMAKRSVDVPVILFSVTDEDDVPDGLKVAAFMAKPTPAKRLVELVDRVVSERG